ncbi:MAG: class I adenylate-forming enzyme family protein [Stellaceae bacterium]
MPQDRYWPQTGPGGRLRLERHFDGRHFRCFSERPPHLDALFRASLARFAGKEAIIAGPRRLTYAALDRLVDQMAGNLARRGVGRGERVALLLGNCPEFLVALLACARLGAVAIPIGTRQKAAELEYLLRDSGAMALIFGAELAAELPAPASVPALRLRVVVGEPVAGAEPVAALLAPGAPPPALSIAEEDTAIILYTSGTTGKPKGAMLSHLNIVHSVIHFARCLGLGEADRALLAVPAAHVTGTVAILLTMVYCGGATALLGEFKARRFLALAAAERITYTLMVPAMYILCLMEADFDRFDLGAWRVGGFGGAPMPEATIAALAQRLPRLQLANAYGATETTSPATVMPLGSTAAHPASVGQVVPCGEVRIVDERGSELPPDTPGEIWIRGPMVVKGYWNKPDATEASFVSGFWRSGDIGAIDAEGFLRVFDRVKDMINRGGYKIFSAEVENALAHHPGVVECAVVGRPDPVLGERVCAFVLPRGEHVTAEDIRRFCAERMADYKVPERVELVREPLPRNANGKVQKAALRERAATGEGLGPTEGQRPAR